MKRLLFLLILIYSVMAFSQQQKSNSYVKYGVKSKETLYSISKQFNVDLEDVIDLNPKAKNGVSEGDTLLLPIKAEKKIKQEKPAKNTSTKTLIHTVEAGQTWYAISRMHGISVNELQEANPEVKDGLKAGMALNIPNSNYKAESTETKPAQTQLSNTTEHQVVAGETLFSLSRKYGISVDEIKAINPSAAAGLSIGQIVKIPSSSNNTQSSTPAAISTQEDIKETVASQAPTQTTTNIYKPIANNLNGKRTIKIALLLPLMLDSVDKQDATIDKFVEFYEGTLIAIELLKQEGISVELSTYDIEKSAVKASKVLRMNPEIRKSDFIIGPAYTDQIKIVSDYGLANQIPVIVPFSSRIKELKTNPFLFQNNTPKTLKLQDESALFIKHFSSYNIILLNFNNDLNDEGSEFNRELAVRLKKQNITFKTIEFTQENFAKIQSQLQIGKENIIVFGTDKEILVKDLLIKLQTKNNASTPISVFGNQKWNGTLEKFPSSYYINTFYIDNKNPLYIKYKGLFKSKFGFISTKDSPRFDLLGYDLCTYFTKAALQYGKAFPASLSGFTVANLLQSELKFEKQAEGGYINRGAKIIHYTKEGGVKELE